ncbi:MAG: bleomycin resistance protein [Verrucomicrobiaceae bacterium]|nr:MAG: bleomycin resistance protein [Verrucomicrobiaceae bacterium]
MNPVALNLVVLRSGDMERAAEFYRCLGLEFSRHRHGKGPEHFAAELGTVVFEIYPLAGDGSSTLGTRIGFSIPSMDDALEGLKDFPDSMLSAPADSPWGLRAVVVDPDGHRVELIQSNPR